MKGNIKFKVFSLLALLKISLSGHVPPIPAGHRVQYYLLHPSGGYKYGYDTGSSNYFAQQHGDQNNQVEGQYAYRDESNHNIGLKYTAGVQGFVPVSFDYTNLYQKYQPGHFQAPHSHFLSYAPKHGHFDGPRPDGSYSFAYSAGDHSREESADAAGNVRGSFWYINKDGKQDLSYIARSPTGFQPTGGSLATPNLQGAQKSQHTFKYHHQIPPSLMISYAPQYSNHVQEGPNPDGSYHFSYSTDDQARQENADSSGNVRGSYWYINKDGRYDLSYIAGVSTGFQPTSGNSATPVHLPGAHVGAGHVPHQFHSQAPGDDDDLQTTEYPGQDESNTGDASYSFRIDTDEYQREESSDPQGNVQGQYSYQNKDGRFDLSYEAGPETGFVATGGNLASPETIPKAHSPIGTVDRHASPETNIQHLGDAAYSYSFDAGNYQKQESADEAGNVSGRYSYQDDGGSHDLSYKASAATGFVPVGGSLSVPNGLTGADTAQSDLKAIALGAGTKPPFVSIDANLSPSPISTHEHSAMNGVLLKSFVPLVLNEEKYGYIFKSKH